MPAGCPGPQSWCLFRVQKTFRNETLRADVMAISRPHNGYTRSSLETFHSMSMSLGFLWFFDPDSTYWWKFKMIQCYLYSNVCFFVWFIWNVMRSTDCFRDPLRLWGQYWTTTKHVWIQLHEWLRSLAAPAPYHGNKLRWRVCWAPRLRLENLLPNCQFLSSFSIIIIKILKKKN